MLKADVFKLLLYPTGHSNIISAMQAASESHLNHEELSKEDKEKLKTLGEWLSKEDTKFEEATGGLKRCTDPQLRQKLHELFTTVEFAQGVGSSTLNHNSS